MKAQTIKQILKRPIECRWISAITPRGIKAAGVILSFNADTMKAIIQRVDGRKDFETHIDNIKYR